VAPGEKPAAIRVASAAPLPPPVAPTREPVMVAAEPVSSSLEDAARVTLAVSTNTPSVTSCHDSAALLMAAAAFAPEPVGCSSRPPSRLPVTAACGPLFVRCNAGAARCALLVVCSLHLPATAEHVSVSRNEEAPAFENLPARSATRPVNTLRSDEMHPSFDKSLNTIDGSPAAHPGRRPPVGGSHGWEGEHSHPPHAALSASQVRGVVPLGERRRQGEPRKRWSSGANPQRREPRRSTAASIRRPITTHDMLLRHAVREMIPR
jgi:hypothetical protein